MIPENIRVGQWVAISGHRAKRHLTCDGTPMKVKAINLPFIVVDVSGDTATLDTRAWSLTRIHSRAYLTLTLAAAGKTAQSIGLVGTPIATTAAIQPTSQRDAKPAPQPDPLPGVCPTCGNSLIRRYISVPSERGPQFVWIPSCPSCGPC
jgi:hypothetical protein